MFAAGCAHLARYSLACVKRPFHPGTRPALQLRWSCSGLSSEQRLSLSTTLSRLDSYQRRAGLKPKRPKKDPEPEEPIDEEPPGEAPPYKPGSVLSTWPVYFVLGCMLFGSCFTIPPPSVQSRQQSDDPFSQAQVARIGNDWFKLTIQNVEESRWLTLLTSGLGHGNIEHLAPNSLGIWIWGRHLCWVYGPGTFLIAFGAGVLLGNLTTLLRFYGMAKDDRTGTRIVRASLGASGGACAIEAVAALMAPFEMVMLPPPIVSCSVTLCRGRAWVPCFFCVSPFGLWISDLDPLPTRQCRSRPTLSNLMIDFDITSDSASHDHMPLRAVRCPNCS
jgi:membrane associated rhomboid family serine protease